MSFFQNPLPWDFQGSWVLGDRQFSPTFKCPANAGRGDEIVCVWNVPPYNLSGNDTDGNTTNTLVIKYAKNDVKSWHTLSINIASGAVSSSAVTQAEIINNLNSNEIFASHFVASYGTFDGTDTKRILIKQRETIARFRFYIANGRAEEKLNFNKKAGVAELPSYFSRHAVGNHATYPDGQSMLVLLDVGDNVDAAVVDNAVDYNNVSLGLDSGDEKADYELLGGRSGIFTFQKNTVDGSDRITQIIEYHAGARAGDLARKINYTYSGANLKPSQITEIPYVLQSADLITP